MEVGFHGCHMLSQTSMTSRVISVTWYRSLPLHVILAFHSHDTRSTSEDEPMANRYGYESLRGGNVQKLTSGVHSF